MDLVIGEKDEFNQTLAEHLDAGFLGLEKHVFPDGELRPRLIGNTEQIKGKEILLVNRTGSQKEFRPNRLLAETLFTLKNLKSLGAKRISLLWPYLVYSMQDKVFRKGEPASAKYVLQLLKETGADKLFVVCAHMQREGGRLEFAKGIIEAHTISVFKDLADYLNSDYDFKNPVVVAPDFTFGKSADKIAEYMETGGSAAIHKKRDLDTGDTEIEEEDLEELGGRDVIIVDDIAETGGTMAKAVDLCKKRGAGRIICAVVHAVLAGNCLQRIKKRGADFISTNTIHSPISKIRVEERIADYLREET